MRKYIVVSLALALAGGSVWAGGLDLLSRAELRRAREARLATPMRAPWPLAVKGGIRPEGGSRIGGFVCISGGDTCVLFTLYGGADLACAVVCCSQVSAPKHSGQIV